MLNEFKYFNEEWNKKNNIMLEFKDLKFETRGYGDDVLGWQDRDEITELMKLIQNKML